VDNEPAQEALSQKIVKVIALVLLSCMGVGSVIILAHNTNANVDASQSD